MLMTVTVLGRMYIIVEASAALGGRSSPAPACDDDLDVGCPPTFHPNLPLLRSATDRPVTLTLSFPAFAFLHTPSSPITPASRVKFHALALALPVRTTYHCRGLRSWLHNSGTPKPVTLQHCSTVALGLAFWSCLVEHTACSHCCLPLSPTHRQPSSSAYCLARR